MGVTIFLAISGAFAHDGCTKGSEFEPPLCALTLPKITKITIVENAAKAPIDTTDASCSGFTVKENQVRRFFSKAMVTKESDAHHALDWSPCHASGKLVLSDGISGDWSVSQTRTGSLVLSNGMKFDLYCPGCTFKPFR